MPIDPTLPYDDENIFARILRGEIPSTRVYEDDWAIAFEDINPQAAVHTLIVPRASYVASLTARGVPAIARKLGEEAVEAVVAALSGSDEELVGEAADVLFHLTVLLAAKGVRLERVMAELERREGTSGLAEKAGRSA